MAKGKKVVIGMSGGVDSSVSAKLLLDEGYDVVGLFMHNWEDEDDGQCTSADDWQDAKTVCGKLGIPCYSVNFAGEYMERVFKYFLEEYSLGRTPNPDVLCNREIKFGPFADYAKKLGADYIATGHYCGISHENGDTVLLKAVDQNKDQTYFLNQVSAGQLSNVIFPLAKYDKPTIRKIAEENGLVTASKKDSTGICFIGERKFKEFLKTYLPAKSGNIVDTNGKVIGKHDGLMYYTLGQRKGLGIGGLKGEEQNRWFVVDKELKGNNLIVSNGEQDVLFARSLITSDLNYIGKLNFIDGGKAKKGVTYKAMAKTRYRQPDQECTVVYEEDNKIRIDFVEPQRAVTPGQYVVLYIGDRCVGGGVIKSSIR